jgi:hypothetical protein
LAIIKAKTPQEACDNVEIAISNFGDDNNWRTICGCVSIKNEVHDCGDGRYSPLNIGLITIAKINSTVRRWIKKVNIFGNLAKEKIKKAKGKIDFSEWQSYELFSLQKYAEHLKEQSYVKGVKFDVRNLNEFYPHNFTECGVTNLVDESAEGILYVVLIDMHD